MAATLLFALLAAGVGLLFAGSAPRSALRALPSLELGGDPSELVVRRRIDDGAAGAHRVAVQERAASQSTRHRQARLLIVAHSAGFQHDVVRRETPRRLSIAEQAVADLARRSGDFVVSHLYTRAEIEALRPEGFQRFDAVLLFTTGDLPMSAPVRESLFGSIRGGLGLIGVHSATDTWHNAPEYAECIGGRFDGYPWHQRVRIVVEDRADPATRHLGEAFSITDEIYQFREWARESVHVLLCLDPRSVDVTKGARRDQDYALAWYRTCGSGRVFYTALGHRPEVWADDRFRLHLLEGIRWALRLR